LEKFLQTLNRIITFFCIKINIDTMIVIRVFNDIQKPDVFMSMFGFDDMVFSADTVHNIFDQNPEETDFKFNINCDGGSVSEGLRIYDILRTSGKNIHCNIENSCHSMAIILLLAAAKENRTANPNARALIHEVRGLVIDEATAEELRSIAIEIEKEQKNILDIYEERTGTDRATLENLMKEEKQRTAQELKKYGFISKINQYTTNKFFNKNNKTMAKTKEISLKNRVADWMRNAANLLTEVENYDFTDNDGNVLFSTESADDTLEVGMAATPDGTFELPDGRTVTIAEGTITDIINPQNEELENLRNENAAMRESLAEAQSLITELNNQIGSKYNVTPRNKMPQTRGIENKTSEQKKLEAKQKMAIMKGGK